MDSVTVTIAEAGFAPVKATTGSIGYDIANVKSVILQPGQISALDTGLTLEFPDGIFGQIKSRSSAFLEGLLVHDGLIDTDYKGELKILVINLSENPKTVERGTRLAQLVIKKKTGYSLSDTAKKPIRVLTGARGRDGFGSSGRQCRGIDRIITLNFSLC